jgi:hypothetical protein
MSLSLTVSSEVYSSKLQIQCNDLTLVAQTLISSKHKDPLMGGKSLYVD